MFHGNGNALCSLHKLTHKMSFFLWEMSCAHLKTQYFVSLSTSTFEVEFVLVTSCDLTHKVY